MKNIFSHRGLPRAYAENTFTGINKSYEYVDFAEVDVRITKDNELILHHDPNIGDININEVSYEELSNLLQHLDIEEIAIKDRSQFSGKVNFEIKTDSLNQTQKDILFQKMLSILNHEDIISSFDWQMILSFKHLFNCQYGIILHKEEELFEAEAIGIHDEEILFMVNKDLFESRNFNLPKERTVLWTVNNELDFQRYLEIDLYGVVTDIPDTMHLYRK